MGRHRTTWAILAAPLTRVQYHIVHTVTGRNEANKEGECARGFREEEDGAGFVRILREAVMRKRTLRITSIQMSMVCTKCV
jgi:hypothetical protein